VRANLCLLFTAAWGFSDPVDKLDGRTLAVGLLEESERTILCLAVVVACSRSNSAEELDGPLLAVGLPEEVERTILFVAFAVACGRSNPTDELDDPLLAVGLPEESERTSLSLAFAVACGRSNPTDDELEAPDLATDDGAESSRRFLRAPLTTSCLWPNAADELVESVFVTGLMFAFPSKEL